MQSISTAELLFYSAILGLIVGSFLSMLTWRLPRLLLAGEENWLKPISVGGSKCPQCDSEIPWYKLIPLFSWVLSKGKCHNKNCDSTISIRYPLIEIATASLTALSMWKFGLNIEGIAATLFSWILIAIFIVDWEHQLILDIFSLPLLWLGLLFNTQNLFISPVDAIWGAAVGYLLLWLVYHLFKIFTGKEGMGYGDFKLLAALGAWLGVLALPQIILIAALSSILITLIGIALKQRDKNTPMAFGPFLAIAGWIALFAGPNLI
jgi:leader peptidase (prepilin peptidase)/N-methyltransferase